eukprot:c17290_g1_i2 orf=54-398(-)
MPSNFQQRMPIPESTSNLHPQNPNLHTSWNQFPHKETTLSARLIGSKPPNCQNKCNTCSPCSAVQIPTSPAQGNPPTLKTHPQYYSSNVQESEKYSNYKPVGWKCKCGKQLYNP